MRFIKANISEVDLLKRGYKRTKLQKLLGEFVESGIAVAELQYGPDEYKSPTSVQSTLYKSIKTFNHPGLRTCIHNGTVYLINEALLKGKEEEK